MSLPIRFQQQNLAERRRRDITRIEDMRVKDTTVNGRCQIFGIGKVLVDIDFPVTFSKKPNFNWGAEMPDGWQPSVDFETLPRLHPVIVRWSIVGTVDGAFEGRFNGCTIGVSTEGYDDQQLIWMHYSFTGPALRNPLRAAGDLKDEL